MKAGKRPTRRQMEAMISVGLDPKNWLVYKKVNGELHLIHRFTEQVRVIPE